LAISRGLGGPYLKRMLKSSIDYDFLDFLTVLRKTKKDAVRLFSPSRSTQSGIKPSQLLADRAAATTGCNGLT
jgi:hypothetical protein